MLESPIKVQRENNNRGLGVGGGVGGGKGVVGQVDSI